MIEVLESILVVIEIAPIGRGRVTSAGKRRDAADLAGAATQFSPERDEADYLSAKDANFQEICGLEFFEQEKPHGMKGVFTEAPAILEIGAMGLKLCGKFPIKKTDAIQIECGGGKETLRPG